MTACQALLPVAAASCCRRRLEAAATFVVTILLALICASATARSAFAADIPPVTDAEVEQALVLAGSNHGELEAALQAGIQKPYTMQALRFVIVSLPAADLGKISAAELVEHVELAMLARSEAAFGSHYDDATWAHYVLPPRVSQEPLSAWRPYLYEQVRETVAGALTIEEAAVAVNRWCGERVVFKQTQTRDQGPLATLAGGYGRCEELCILYIDACRAVGIPARMAYCPWWAVQDNNHAWVEVLGSDSRWHFTGACEPAPTLDDAWFAGAVKSAPIILSPCFGLPGPDELLADVLDIEDTVGARFCRINSTRFYRQTGLLVVSLPWPALSAEAQQELAAMPAAAIKPALTVHVFNYGALRSIAKVELTDQGEAVLTPQVSVELGAGDYVLTTNVPGLERELRVQVTPGTATPAEWPLAGQGEADARHSHVLHFPADSVN